MSKSLLPLPVFHDDLSHSFKQAANDSFRNRQRPPKLYPKQTLHHHHHQHHHQSQPNLQPFVGGHSQQNPAPPPSQQQQQQQMQPHQLQQHNLHPNGAHSFGGVPNHPHPQHHLQPPAHNHHHLHGDSFASIFNRSTSSIATSVSFVGHSNVASAAAAPSAVTQRPLSSPHYCPDRAETYFDQCFVVLARLGEGSFSEVFRVRSLDDGCEYAVKRSKQPYKSERYRDERLEEVRRYEQLARHEHCLRLHFAWEQDDHLYMQLELCRESVDAFVLRQPRPLAEPVVWRVLTDLLLGIKALHDRQLIHLDVKLENIMMDDRGVCKLGDFGLVVDLNKPNLHQSSEGDSRYIAPELMQSRFTKAADVFSFGISALELACNLALPNNGPLWVQLRQGELPECLAECSPELQSLIARSMCPSYANRPGVDELLESASVQAVLRRRRRMRPLRWAMDAPRRVARSAKRGVYYVRSQMVRLVVALLAFCSTTTAHRLREGWWRWRTTRHTVPFTPHRSATTHDGSFQHIASTSMAAMSTPSGYYDQQQQQQQVAAGDRNSTMHTPHLSHSHKQRSMTTFASETPSTASPLQQLMSSAAAARQRSAAATSTPTWQRYRRHTGNADDGGDGVDGGDSFGLSRRLDTSVGGRGDESGGGTPEAIQLLQLDDSEIEGSPRAAKTPLGANVRRTANCGGSSLAGSANGIANSTPLTTHVLGGYRKSRRDASVPSIWWVFTKFGSLATNYLLIVIFFFHSTA